MYIASRASCVAIVSFLLSKGVNANKLSKLTPPQIALACVFDVHSELFVLHSKYTNPVIVESIKNDLHYSNAVTVIDHNDSIEELSKAVQDIDIDFKDSRRWALLHFAALANNLIIAEFLLQKGANPNIRDVVSFHPLQYAGEVDSSRK